MANKNAIGVPIMGTVNSLGNITFNNAYNNQVQAHQSQLLNLGYGLNTVSHPQKDFSFLERKRNPYFLALSSTGVLQPKEAAGAWERIKPLLLRTRGVWNGLPTGPAHLLLMGATPKGLARKATTPVAEFYFMKGLGLLTYVPGIVGRKRASFVTSYNGIRLMEYWCETQPKFQPFYDAYVSKDSVDRAKEMAVDFASDVVPRIIQDAIEKNAIAIKKKEEKEAADLAAFVASQQMTYDTYINTTIGTTTTSNPYITYSTTSTTNGV